jgi:hypothetical protein
MVKYKDKFALASRLERHLAEGWKPPYLSPISPLIAMMSIRSGG